MYRFHVASTVSRLSAIIVAVILVANPLVVLAQIEPAAPAATSGPNASASLESAPRLIRESRFDDAILLMEDLLKQMELDAPTRRRAYLLSIMAYVQKASALQTSQDIVNSRLNLDAAKNTVRRCLQAPGLRHTQPDLRPEFEASSIPPRMIQLFNEVRSEIFGTFEVAELTPPHAMVIMAGDTLTVLPNKSTLGDTDIPAGRYVVVVQATGYQTQTDELEIVPGVNLVRPYTLKKNKGTGWWATRVGVAAAAFVAAGLLIPGGADETPEPLPGPPDPPSGQ